MKFILRLAILLLIFPACKDSDETSLADSDPVTVTVLSPGGLHEAGEDIPVNVEIKNGSALYGYEMEFFNLSGERLFHQAEARIFEKEISIKESWKSNDKPGMYVFSVKIFVDQNDSTTQYKKIILQ